MVKALSFSLVIQADQRLVQDYLLRAQLQKRFLPPWKKRSCLEGSFLFFSSEHKWEVEKLPCGKIQILETITYHNKYALEINRLDKAFEKKIYEEMSYRQQIQEIDLKMLTSYPPKQPCKVLITGSSGFIGSNLKKLLLSFGYDVWMLVRKAPTSSQEIQWDPLKKKIEKEKLEGMDWVIHLCGESIFSAWWTKKKKKAISSSRLDTTHFLIKELSSLKEPPKILFSTSAIGYYGDRGEKKLDETASKGEGFLADVTARWEEEALQYKLGRVILMRFGIVMGKKGGMLKRLIPSIQSGLGAALGSGLEWVSWIDLDDIFYQILHIAYHEELSGAINFTAPCPIRHQEMMDLLGVYLHRKVVFRVPKKLIHFLFGEMGDQLTTSSRVLPKKLMDSRSTFAYPCLSKALNHLLKI